MDRRLRRVGRGAADSQRAGFPPVPVLGEGIYRFQVKSQISGHRRTSDSPLHSGPASHHYSAERPGLQQTFGTPVLLLKTASPTLQLPSSLINDTQSTPGGSPCWWRACSPSDCGPPRQRWPTPLLKGPELSASGRHCSSQQISPEVFVGGSGPARSAPAVRPSAQPFSPPPRSTDGAQLTDVAQPGGRQALHQCQTQGDAHEATRAGIARPGRTAEEPGPGAPPPRFRNSGYPPGPNNGTPEHPQTL